MLLLEFLKNNQNSLLDNKNENIEKHQCDEKVEVSDLKNLISELGRSTPIKTNDSVNTFPKPSCGKFSGRSDSILKNFKNILRKKS